jgi:nicotinamidase-related amidase
MPKPTQTSAASPSDLHGNVPDKSPVVLVLIDVINDLEFDEGQELLEHALPMARRLAALKKRCHAAGIPAIYVNDNFGHWQSDLNAQVRHCLEDGVRGEPIAKLLRPLDRDYFVLKPKHSGFYSSTLEILLRHFGATKLILTGVASNICVLFTANDAYMRDYQLFVPADCVAANHTEDNDRALRQMEKVLKADITPSTKLDLEALLGDGASSS